MTTFAASIDQTLERELPAAASGCQHAYGRIVLACQNTVTAIALAITRDRQASEDIAQEAFVKGWQQLHQLRSSTSFLPWLRQITRNLARDWLRAQRGRPLTGEAAEVAMGMAADPAPGAADRLQRVEEEIAAEDIISALPADSREVLLLYYREGQRSQQVADLLGLSDAAVRKRLSRARALVRDGLLQRFGEFARSSAPSAAFATAVISMVLVAAPGTASAAILLGTGVGVGGSKLGLGGASVAGGTAMGSLTATLGQLHVLPTESWGAIAGGVIGGAIGSYLGARVLLSYTETEGERMQVRRFVRLNTGTGLAWCLVMLLAALLQVPMWSQLLLLALGLGVVNYQCLVSLQRVMAPMIARDSARRGRSGTNWKYESMYGRTGIIGANVFVIGLVVYTLMRSGNV
ncbi:sigma-70 family RNA polymerase sigma factor [Stenotrophomonas maltophilia]|uniref:RNA polymerase sigma factor n=1 Tax=Stenotrophomonas TaxID=40323 RepID=UPI000D0B8F75|nr:MULTISPECIES: sigma-70 family RNA polymerase sigma factor [Stenotrophomonas]AVO29494.1 RNA polymerase subunit sigma-70 [Stenotrophomonas maltophilia]ELC7324228.1 sigma-70 family RNA polymerase sigma factor [Stenotrophomonas maltophilia]MBA0279200.1 sigma-70 family RNA polymerase sigma factor [Stenotrophomonas maltophilia]MBA0414781.1 sigma-70 family RNA polymerase sigma factor [Stenotrophomonas maltophilia]MBA0500185.1 sigma-70 family RNA polymerase sigma factor [Stenotrophomonas maltophili